MKSKNYSLTDHLLELRNRILIIVSSIVICAVLLSPFANTIYNFLSLPLLSVLPEGSSMIAVDVAAPFLAPFKLIVLLAIAITFPISIYNFWAFISPGLYNNERKFVAPILISSTILFYLGILFAYYIVFPLIFSFFTSIAPAGVQIATDITSFLNFVIKIFFAFGLAFEVPIITLVVVLAELTTVESLSRKRPYIIVFAFIIGMILTPPDVISQVLLAIPIWVLFEFGLFLAKIITKNKGKKKPS
jgi:sec-independent protein translocase protein TatC